MKFRLRKADIISILVGFLVLRFEQICDKSYVKGLSASLSSSIIPPNMPLIRPIVVRCFKLAVYSYMAFTKSILWIFSLQIGPPILRWLEQVPHLLGTSFFAHLTSLRWFTSSFVSSVVVVWIFGFNFSEDFLSRRFWLIVYF